MTSIPEPTEPIHMARCVLDDTDDEYVAGLLAADLAAMFPGADVGRMLTRRTLHVQVQ